MIRIDIGATRIVASHPTRGQERESFSCIDPCPNCGSQQTRIGAGRKPQESSLHCSECKRLRWISANQLRTISGNSFPAWKGGAR